MRSGVSHRDTSPTETRPCYPALLPGRIGRTTSPENFTSLINDVSERVFDYLPDETWFYPGHGDDSTLGEQRPHLTEWRERGW
jgi:glyoxylase-like metal-dependent hydrolase (beta-lactamase superfamily II)